MRPKKRHEKYISIIRRGKNWRARVRVTPFCTTATFDTEGEAQRWACAEKSRQILQRDRVAAQGYSEDALTSICISQAHTRHCGTVVAPSEPYVSTLVSTMLKNYVRKVSPRKASGRSDMSRAK